MEPKTQHGYWLDEQRYRVLQTKLYKDSTIVVQESIEPVTKHYCVQYAGNGHYFSSIKEMNQYIASRWGQKYIYQEPDRHAPYPGGV